MYYVIQLATKSRPNISLFNQWKLLFTSEDFTTLTEVSAYCWWTHIQRTTPNSRWFRNYPPPPFLPSYRKLRNRSYTIKLKLYFNPGYSSSYPTSWSHHLIIQLDPWIRSDPVHNSYIYREATCAAMVAKSLYMYSFIGHNPAASITSAPGGYSHSLSLPTLIYNYWDPPGCSVV